MQTVYYTTRNFIRSTGNVVDLAEYRRKLAQAEGSLAPVSCLDCKTPCDQFDSCITIGLYKKIQQAIDGVVDHTTLHDMISDYRAKHPQAENV